jgi:hypothetical protein
VQCKLTPILFFRVCIKHLSKDDGEKICKNNYVNDDTLTDGGLKSLKQSDDSFKVVTYKTYYFGQAITTYNTSNSLENSSNVVEGLLEPYLLIEDRPDNLGMGFRMRINDEQANCQVEYEEDVRCKVLCIGHRTLHATR